MYYFKEILKFALNDLITYVLIFSHLSYRNKLATTDQRKFIVFHVVAEQEHKFQTTVESNNMSVSIS